MLDDIFDGAMGKAVMICIIIGQLSNFVTNIFIILGWR